jgi:hypothetical protein
MEQTNEQAAVTGAAEAASAPVSLRQTEEDARIREESLARREVELARRELHAKALDTLSQRQLPAELADLLDYADEARCNASLSRVQKTWQQAVQKGVEARVAGAAPRTGAGKSGVRTSMRDAISAFYNR